MMLTEYSGNYQNAVQPSGKDWRGSGGRTNKPIVPFAIKSEVKAGNARSNCKNCFRNPILDLIKLETKPSVHYLIFKTPVYRSGLYGFFVEVARKVRSLYKKGVITPLPKANKIRWPLAHINRIVQIAKT